MENFHQVPVWPRALRIIHWVNAFSVLLLIPLGLFILAGGEFLGMPDEGLYAVIDVHATVGFVLAAGAVARIIYLFTGPPQASWRDVVPYRKEQIALGLATVRYYLSGLRGKAPLYLSHNPIAGFFDTILFIVFVTQAASGISIFLGNGGAGEASRAAPWPPEWLVVIHVIGAFFIVFFVLAHFAALGAHEIRERRGLVSSMISGSKFFTEEELRELEPGMRKKGLGQR